MTTHEGIDQREVLDELRRRLPEVVVKTLEQEQPVVAMVAEDAVLGRYRRGIEPMRIVVMPRNDQHTINSSIIEPMPARGALIRSHLAPRAAIRLCQPVRPGHGHIPALQAILGLRSIQMTILYAHKVTSHLHRRW